MRKGDYPLDRTSMFSSYDDAVLYANGGKDSRGLSGVSYVGQIITVYENGKVDVYKIGESRNLENISPIIIGDMPNSAVLEGEYEGYSNKAISQVSVSLGAATTAGLKGWYYSAIDFTNNIITLSDKQPYALLGNLVGGSWKSGTPNISVGDKVSIVNNAKYDYCGEVKSISGNKVTLKSALPFNTLDIGTITANNPDDWSIYLPDKESAGIIDFGGGALSEGVNTKATNIGSHAEGIQTHAYGQYSHTEGFKTSAGYAAHAEGKDNVASGEQSHAEGKYNKALGNNSHVEGNSNIANDYSAHAEGYGSVVSSDINHEPTINDIAANAAYSHAEGNGTVVRNHSAHAEGRGTIVLGNSAHAEGLKTQANGNASHAEGNKTISNGSSSHAEGLSTITNNIAEHASGKYNVSIPKTIDNTIAEATQFSIGIGTSDTNRKNALEVKQNGDVYINGITLPLATLLSTADTDDDVNEVWNEIIK